MLKLGGLLALATHHKILNRVEELRTLYDPYYAALERLLGELRDAHGHAVLLDGHTGSLRRMKGHQVILGTCHDTTCAPALFAAVASVFTRHGFDLRENVQRLHRW